MRARGLEPPRSYEHMDLNHACLPIPARPRATRSLAVFRPELMGTCVRMAHPTEMIDEVLRLRVGGLGARRIARQTGLPLGTVKDWVSGRLPRRASISTPQHLIVDNVDAYAYLLGMYLGD